jgi:two-component system, chemotaxis family, response regulator Rcp1
MKLKHHILLVEDNDGDMILTMEAITDNNHTHYIYRVTDGEQAIDYLNKVGEYANEETPDLILLDINLPRLDGKEVLVYVKNSEPFRMIPVVILSTSTSDTDIIDCYKLGANCYINKPSDLNDFLDVIKTIEKFWLKIVKLPFN